MQQKGLESVESPAGVGSVSKDNDFSLEFLEITEFQFLLQFLFPRVCMHTYIHAYIHTYMHTYKREIGVAAGELWFRILLCKNVKLEKLNAAM